MAEDLTDAICENAEGPEDASADGVRVKRHGLKDQIEADKYLAGKFNPLDFQKYLQERHPEIWNAGTLADRTAPQKLIYPFNQ